MNLPAGGKFGAGEKGREDRLPAPCLPPKKMPNLAHPVPVAFAGGTARVRGFQAALQEALESADLPIEISVVRLSKDPLNTTAKGALVAAVTNM